jgi:sugar lactone lactonase YvrE
VAPPPLGEFPLAAVKAAKAQAYVAANAHLEGPTYRDGEVFFAADGAGWGLMRIDADRKLYRYHPRLLPVGTYLLSGGRILIGEHDLSLVMMYPDGKVAAMPVELDGQQIPFANDVTVDAEGNIYASDRRGGGIYRITPAGQVSRVIAGQDVPNGVEIDPASKYLYFVTGSALNRLALPGPGETSYGKVERLAAAGQPDGMQFDAWGNLWVADWAAKHLVVYDHEGKTITTVDSGGAPINLTFGGKDNDTVFVVNDFKGVAKIGPVPGLRGFLHPGAPNYTIKKMLDLVPANQPVQ